MTESTITSPPARLPEATSTTPIAVAIVPVPHRFNYLAFRTIQLAIQAGLTRHAITEHSPASGFANFHCVRIFEVWPRNVSRAIQSVRETLNSLGLLDRSIIAQSSIDDTWHILHGALLIGGVDFAKAFLDPEILSSGSEQASQDAAAVERFIRESLLQDRAAGSAAMNRITPAAGSPPAA